jgi:hypothetical protein
MAKIWQRKRNGEFFGSFYVTVRKKPVNLQTKNARVARSRAGKALAGTWPDSSTADAARSASAAAQVEADAESAQGPSPSALNASLASAPMPPPTQGASSAPAAASEPPSDAAADPGVAAAGAAAAADIAAEDSGEQAALASGVSEMKAELAKLFDGQGGGDSVDPGEFAAAVQFGVSHGICNFLAGKMKPPREIPEPAENSIFFRVCAIGWRVQLRRWESALETIEPWHLILGAGMVQMVQLIASAKLKELESPKPETLPS